MKNKYALLLIIVFFFTVIANCGKDKQKKSNIIPQEPTLVKVFHFTTASKAGMRAFPGKIQANQRVDMSFEVAGKLIVFPVVKGQKVKADEVLAKLDPENFGNNLKETQAAFLNAKSQFERAKKLIPKGYISQSDYDKIESAFLQSEAKMNVAKKALDDTVLKAPFTGIIANTFVKNYQNVKEKEKILSLQDISHVDILINVPEQDLIFIKPGQMPDNYITVDSIPNRKFQVTPKEIATEANSLTNTYEATLTMPTPADINLLPGMSVTFMIKAGFTSLQIPVEALVDEQGHQFVWIINEKNQAHKQPVTVGAISSYSIQILSGLKGDESIITAGLQNLTEGMPVRVWKP